MTIPIGTNSGTATVTFKGGTPLTDKPIPAGAKATFTSTTSAHVTIGAVTQPTADSFQAELNGIAAGNAQIHVHLESAGGTQLTNKAGAVIADPAPVTVTVAPTTKTTPTQATLTVP